MVGEVLVLMAYAVGTYAIVTLGLYLFWKELPPDKSEQEEDTEGGR